MKMPQFFSLLFLLVHSAYSLNILVTVPFPLRSHFSSFSKLFKTLAMKGHTLTVISYYSENISLPNYRHVDIGNMDKITNLLSSSVDFKKITRNRLSTYLDVSKVAMFGHLACDMFFKSVTVQNFLKEENTFDLIFLEDFFSECVWPIVQKYRSPVVRLVSQTLFPWNGRLLANPLATSYVPNIYMPQEHNMSFFDRLENSIVNLYLLLFFELNMVPKQTEIAKKYVQVNEHTFDTKYFNTSIVLMNTHYVFQHPRPLVPNMIEVGGIHIVEAQKLPQVSLSVITVKFFHIFPAFKLFL